MRPFLSQTLAALAVWALPLAASAIPLKFELKPDRPVVTEGAGQDLVLRLNLHADPIASKRRTPLNLCLVLDKSGSMGGGKIERLRDAAAQAVGRLRSDDILSIVVFSDGAQVLLPATMLRERQDALRAIENIQADGGTALYAGMREGLAEVKKFKGKGRISRILLLSDGLANVGPSSPSELATLGREAGRLGVPVTTFGLGLGYGEDLMTQLAYASDGNHAFIPDEGGLQAFLDKEMGEALGIAARDLVVEIKLGPGVKLKGSLDRDVEERGDIVRWKLNQLPGGVDKRLLLELQAPALGQGEDLSLASATVNYADADGKGQVELTQVAMVKGGTAVSSEASLNKAVAGEALQAKANKKREEAIKLKDEGRTEDAAAMLQENARSLRAAGAALGSSSVSAEADAYENEAAAVAAPAADWNATRKDMKAKAHKSSTQQSY